MKRDGQQYAGNSISEQKGMVDEAFARWQADLQVNEILENLFDGGVYVRSFRLVSPKNPGGNWLCVVAATMESGNVVGFVTGSDCIQALRDAVQQAHIGKIKWQEDKYAK